MNRKSSSLILLLIAVNLAYFALYLGVLPALLQLGLGVLIVAFLPGYFISELLFPYLKNSQRLTLSLGFSLVFVILLGFGLHLAGFGLVKDMWLAVSFYSTVILGIAVLFRVSRQSSREDSRPFYLPKLHEPLFLLVALGIAGAAVAMASNLVERQDTPITQLWVLPQTSGTLDVGVVSNEIDTFRLEITGDGEELFNELVVTANAKAKVIPLELTENYDRLEATLYKTDSSTPYRRVVLW